MNKIDIRQLAKAIDTELIIENVCEIIAEQCNPEDIFSDDKLCEWAKRNGFIKLES